jgi:hypothetical protein
MTAVLWAVVVGDQMDLEMGGDVGVDDIEELAKLRGSVASVALADDLASGNIEGSKE